MNQNEPAGIDPGSRPRTAPPAQPAQPTDRGVRDVAATAVPTVVDPGGAGGRVPVTVWPTTPLLASCPDCTHDHVQPLAGGGRVPCAGRVSAPVAALVVKAFSRPGEQVFAPQAGTGAVLVAAASLERPVTGVARDGEHAERLTCRLERDLNAAQRGLVRITLAAHRGEGDAGRLTGRVALLVDAPYCYAGSPVRCPGPDVPGGEDDARAQAALWQERYRMLRPGGLAVVLTRDTVQLTANGGRLIERIGHTVAGARAAGLVYLQHIVALHAAIRDDRLVAEPAAADRALLRWAQTAGLRPARTCPRTATCSCSAASDPRRHLTPST
jgi:hypothetical protein